LTGVVALVTLAAHGSYYVALKTDEDLGRRAQGFALLCWPLQFFLTFSTLIATFFIRPEIMTNFAHHKIGLLVPIVVVASLGVMLWANPKGKEKLAFIASSAYITAMLVGAAFALYPVVLPARDHQYDLTIYNTAAGIHGLKVGFAWWTLGAVLAVGYFLFIYRMFRGKVQLGEGHY
jgi:cytochrome d ubiquinol oxidase subunit II